MKKKALVLILILINLFFIDVTLAFPKEIVVVRHGDRLKQKESGPTLTPKGIIRSMALAFYYLDKFGQPDFIFATNPSSMDSKKGTSIRELQTVAPLANMMAEKFPDQGFPIMHPYLDFEYEKLAKDVLNNANYNDKKILICWNHTQIPNLAKALGVSEPIKKWDRNDFDSVYVLKYNNEGKLTEFNILSNQYDVLTNPSWKDLYDKIKRAS